MDEFFYRLMGCVFYAGIVIILVSLFYSVFKANQYQIKKQNGYYAVYYKKNMFRPWVKITPFTSFESAVEFINRMDV